MPGSEDDRNAALELLQQLFESGRPVHETLLQQLCQENPALSGALRAAFAELCGLRELIDLSVGSILAELRARHGAQIDPTLSAADPGQALPAGLGERAADRLRYHPRRELGRGGGGVVFEVWDEDLRRKLAMKVASTGKGLESDGSILSRFLEEAQVTGQIDHPGVVPLHELGLDAQGRVYFTMRLVRGRELREIFELVREGGEGWNRTRALGVLLKVCETMAFAHSKGVVHRDLKPANVMVGRFGEVYVMDWGLAKVQGRRDTRDLRPRPPEQMTLSSVHTARRDESDFHPDAALVTMDGTVVGTPAYMPPEQAQGQIEQIGPRSDVYSLGAMLYHLLSGHAPYWKPGARLGAYTILALVLQGPPPALRRLARGLPAELEAICEKAMARDPAQRYADTMALADDLRAFLEGRVVAAYEAGALAELRKWVGRNRALATASLVAVLALVVGTLVSNAQRVEARARAEDVLRLADERRLEELEQEARTLWPAHPENVHAYHDWLARSDALMQRIPEHQSTLARLEARGQRADPVERAALAAAHPRFEELEALRRKLSDRRALLLSESLETEFQADPAEVRRVALEEVESLEARLHALEGSIERDLPELDFDSHEDAWWHSRLSALVHAARQSRAPGALYDDVRARLDFAGSIAECSVSGEQAATRWARAIESIADPEDCPRYAGLRVVPQMGLLPIGRDSDSGLWEFTHLYSGEAAERDEEIDPLTLQAETGLVLVLLPGSLFDMGAQARSSLEPGYDTLAEFDESPVRAVALDPFFLSKYELTQAQWQRVMGENPSVYGPGFQAGAATVTPLHPVEGISWHDAQRCAQRCGLTLPTEAQWEYASRAGTTTSWWTGDEEWSVAGADNLPDASARAYVELVRANWSQVEHWVDVDDGHVVHSPVDAFEPNPFGLHGTLGNVAEWCRDGYRRDYAGERTPGEAELLVDDLSFRVLRGGAFMRDPRQARCANRQSVDPEYSHESVGVRMARPLATRPSTGR